MKYRIRNNSTGEERVVSEAELPQYGFGGTTSPYTTTAPEPEEARLGPLLGNLLQQTRTAQYVKKLPEIYGGITEDIKEKGLGYYSWFIFG